MNRTTLVPAMQLAIRAAVAGGLAVAIAHLLQLPFPIYAMIAAVVVTDLSPSPSRHMGLPRIAGTALGAAIGAISSTFLAYNPLTVGFGILVAILLSEFIGLENSAKMAGYVCGIVILNHGDHPWVYATHRLIETGLGISAAVLVSIVPKLLPEQKPAD